MSFDYSGKTVFVAGGTSGINLGVAKAFAKAGARVSVLSRRQEKVDATVEALKALGAEANGYAADVRDYAAVEAALQAAHGQFGAFDVLVSGAAGNFPAKATGMSANAFKSVVDIDLLGTYHVLRAAHPLMKKPGGSIINISAPQAFLPMNMQMHVCSAKAGVDMVTRVGGPRVGFGRPAGQFRRPRPHRGHRRHGAPRPHRGRAQSRHRQRADEALRPGQRDRRLLPVAGQRHGGLRHRCGHSRRRAVGRSVGRRVLGKGLSSWRGDRLHCWA